jgi:hypothetical protein
VLARAAESDRETRRVAETVRSLSAERDRIAMRIDGVEREMGDLTGSISKTLQSNTLQNSKQDRQPMPEPVVAAAETKAQIPAPVAPAMAPSMAPATGPHAPLSNTSLMHIAAPAPLDPKATRAGWPMTAAPETVAVTEPAVAPVVAAAPPTVAAPETVAVPTVPLIATENIPLPRPSPLVMQRNEAAATAEHTAASPETTASSNAANVADSKSEPQPRVEIGIDLGPALSIARLRNRWDAFKKSQGPAADGMRPVVSVREIAQNKPVELRLVVGPLADVGAAAQLCASLAGSQFPCQPAVFDGQRLAVQ